MPRAQTSSADAVKPAEQAPCVESSSVESSTAATRQTSVGQVRLVLIVCLIGNIYDVFVCLGDN